MEAMRTRFALRATVALSTVLLAAVMLICIPQGQAQAAETSDAAAQATVQLVTETLSMDSVSVSATATDTQSVASAKQASGKKSKWGLLAKNGKVYPCNKKGKKIGKYWKSGSTIKYLFVAANAKKVPTNMKYTRVGYGGPVKAKIKTIKFLTKKGKSKVKTIAKNSIHTTVSKVENFQKTQVTTIGEGAFAGTKIKAIALPKTLVTIGKKGFYGCTKLTSVNASNTKLKSVGESGFESCTALTTVSLPATCKSLGNYAFYGCTSLKTLKMLSPTVVPFKTRLLYNTKLYNGAAGAYIYVPSSALPSYKTADLWSDYYAYGIIKGA